MKITTLIENHTPTDSPLPCEHGLSFWIETCGKKLIFDTGATGQFIDNAEKLGINLSEADMAILSHGHDDHSGGFRSFTEKAEKKLKVYVGKGFFQPKFKKNSDSDYQYGGNDFTEEEIMDLGCSLTEVDGKTLDLGQGLTLFREFTAEYLAGLNLEFLACVHCTGDEAMKYFKEVFGNRLWVNMTGTKMTL